MTREQRLAEKELNEKLEKNALTLEDWLESERYKLAARLGGELTPVTAESFAAWKKDRMDKKMAEDEAKRAKDATGRMLFEKGDWKVDIDSDDEDGDDDGIAWNLAALRRETEAARQQMEEMRLTNGRGTDASAESPAGEEVEVEEENGDDS